MITTLISFLLGAALVLSVIFVLGAPILAVVLVVRTSKEALRTYRAAAAHAGLTQVVERRSWGDIRTMDGCSGPFRVSIMRDGRNYSDGRRTLILVDGKGHIPSSLNLRPEGLGSRIDKALGDRDVVTGDAGFDSEVYARGPEDVLRALCDARARSLLRALASMDGVVAGGNVRVTTRKAPQNVEPVTAALETALGTARHLVAPENAVERIVELVKTDPEVGVREQCLMYLVRAHRDSPAVQALIHEALTMPAPELRVRAAIALGVGGQATLLELVGNADLGTECAADGIRALGDALSELRCIGILESARRLDRRPVAQAVIEALGQRGTAAAVAPLRTVVETHAFDSGLRRDAEQAIARIQSRLTGAEAGQISIPEGPADAGQLSLAKEASGEVSLDQPTAERGRVTSRRRTETE